MVFQKIRKYISLVLTILSVIVLSSCTFNFKTEVINPTPPVDEDNTFVNRSKNKDVNYVYDILEKNYYLPLPLDLTKINDLETLLSYTDPYTYIYEVDSRSIDKDENYGGIGITISNHDDGLLITDLNFGVEDLIGLVYPGDIITKVEGVNLQGLGFEAKTVLLKGEVGTTKDVLVRRDTNLVNVTLKLIDVPFKSVVYKLIEQGSSKIGYIKINRFSGETATKFEEALTNLKALNMEKLLIDVRDNGGGYLSAVVDILRQFVYGEEPFLFIENVKSNQIDEYKPNEDAVRSSYDILMLVNGNSASASEVLAGTLRQYNYKLFGEKTYGKDVFQYGIRLSSINPNHILNVTAGYWKLKDQSRVKGGLIPDLYNPQTGIHTYKRPIINQTFKKGDSHPVLGLYQMVLATFKTSYYQEGYFDDHTEALVRHYQGLKDGLTTTGILDMATQQQLYQDYYKMMINDVYDTQLSQALSYLGGQS